MKLRGLRGSVGSMVKKTSSDVGVLQSVPVSTNATHPSSAHAARSTSCSSNFATLHQRSLCHAFTPALSVCCHFVQKTTQSFRLLKRTASSGHVWLLLPLLLCVIIISIIIIIIGRLSGIPEQHPRTDRFVAVTDALEATQHRLPYTRNLRLCFHLLTAGRHVVKAASEQRRHRLT